jgi:hypothetical protein
MIPINAVHRGAAMSAAQAARAMLFPMVKALPGS